ncbi:alpha/beta hydrolase [Spirillospora sp. NBC_01491]|uniref:alpha/beta hydrolase n=1 Tax=Spirillospora sp. NBC_01491 TaxID=2976007 RepID=UPI002E35DEC7|nr:alpha/beta hydrolase [Spirillospora sp. NBC_01491]
MTASIRPVPVRPVATTAAERRIARALALEPGGPPSLQARVTGQVIRMVVKSVWQRTPDTDAGLARFQRVTELMSAVQRVPRGVAITPQDLGTCTAEWVRAGAPDQRKVFLQMHGGGYFFGGPRLYRGFNWRLSAATGRPVLALDYRLAPQHHPADALHDALTAYDFLRARGYAPEDIVVGGDSAGGHLTLALLLALKERGTALPAAAIVLSPWADLLCESDSHRLNRRSEVLVPAERIAWLGRHFSRGRRHDDPLLSPRNGDLAGLPPLMLTASSTEILRDETLDVAERARAAGVRVLYQEWEGLAHVFPMFAEFMPEGKAAFRHMAEFLRAARA